MTDRRATRVLAAVGMTSVVVVATLVATWTLDRVGPPPPAPAPGVPDPADWDTLVDLAGDWDFRVGDDRAWADGRSGAGWSRIAAPGAWENAGYHGYDGFAWYRTTFELSGDALDRARRGPTAVHLGRIDDADEVWVNGLFVGKSGRMPADTYATGLFAFRTYALPPDVLRAGTNTIAVRVYDGGLEGGLLEGPLALVAPTAQNPASMPLVADLAGDWRLRLGDDPGYADPALDDADWASLRVPGTWEPQGYAYDGFAWVRAEFELSAGDADDESLLVLGAVDDLDQAFVNGVMVGATGDIESRVVVGDEWQRERAYRVPAGVLRPGRNVVAVRIYDGFLDGGIYRGPVGLAAPKDYDARLARR